MTKRNKRDRRTELSVTPLVKHKRVGKDLLPPFAEMGRKLPLQPTDWPNDRLPEMIWAAILLVGLGRAQALERFGRLANVIGERCQADESRKNTLRHVTLSGLATWSDDEFSDFLEIAIQGNHQLFAILLRFDGLPGVERWRTAISDDLDSFDILKTAVGNTLWHQSQDSTDCRWMRVIAAIASGSMLLPIAAEEMAREISEYPNYGDQQKVRPSIRSHEGILDVRPDGYHKSTWAPQFWLQAFNLTRDDHTRFGGQMAGRLGIVTFESLQDIREALRLHSDSTAKNTDVDPRHEATFGLATYALDVLGEMLSVGNSNRILGRMGLRCLCELAINFAFLARRDDSNVWQRFRDYGYGQAKLAYLKLLVTKILPSYVSVESLEGLANEDIWHEFREIHIGNWDESTLRSAADSAGLKEAIYDKYYDWTSAFVHANWGALRDSVYDLCLNPLHRLHRIPSLLPKGLPDVISDAVGLVNQALETVDVLYPSFPDRLRTEAISI